MAYGVLTNAALLSIGLPPAQASALVHTAEIFTTGASAASHIYHRNVDWRLRDAARRGRRARRDPRRLGTVERRCHGGAALRLLLSAGAWVPTFCGKSLRIAAAAREPAGWTCRWAFSLDFSTPAAAAAGARWSPRR